MAQPETLLVGQIRRAVKRRFPDAMIQKLHGGQYQTAGLPDLVIVVDGRIYGFEVKKRRQGESEAHAYGRATLRQKARIADLKRAGGVAAVVLSVEEVLALLPDS